MAGANNNALNAFKKTLPSVEHQYGKVLHLEFFALCPNGNRIPVKEICAAYERGETGLVLRTVEDRLALVIQAVFPGEPQPYWQQAFYLSTGESSGMPDTWLPFNGILMDADISRKMIIYYPHFEYRNRRNNEKIIFATGWFSKEEFCARQERCFPYFPTELQQKKEQQVARVYGKLYLPEGDLLSYRSKFDRFGTFSFVLASHALGGKFFSFKSAEDFNSILNESPYREEMVTRLDQISPLQPCFPAMRAAYPIAKPNEVNAYIEKHQAFSYMNAFRPENLFAPGLSFLQVPIKSLGYAMPIKMYYYYLQRYISDLFYAYKTGQIPLDVVRHKIRIPPDELQKLFTAERPSFVFPNEQNFRYNFAEHVYQTKPQMRKYFGGNTKRRRGLKSKKTRKQ